MNKFLKNLLLLSVIGITIVLFNPAHAFIPEEWQTVIDYSKNLPKKMSNTDKIKAIQERFSIGSDALARAFLISNFLTPELADQMFNNRYIKDNPYYSYFPVPILMDSSVEDYQKGVSLTIWVQKNIEQDSRDKNSINIYSILWGCSFDKVKAIFEDKYGIGI